MIKVVLKNLRYVRYAIQADKISAWSIILLSMAISSMSAAKILAIGQLLDDVALSQSFGFRRMIVNTCLVVFVYLMEYVLSALQNYLRFRICIRLNNQMEDKFFLKLSVVQYSLLEDKKNSDLIFHVKDGIEKRFSDGFSHVIEFFSFAFRAAGVLGVIITKNISTGMILLLLFVSLGPLYQKLGEVNYQAYAEANKAFRRAKSYLQILSDREYANEREVFGYDAFFNKKWRTYYQTAIEKERGASKQNHFKILLVTITITFMTALLSCIMIPALLRESLSLGVYVLVVTQLFNLVHFMSWNFSDITENLSENALYLDDFDRFMDLNDTTRAEGGILPSQKHINIRIEDLSFRYPGCTDYALKNVSFEFKEGVHYAIVGKNGAGKTTLVKLLLGLYDEYDGQILINGVDIRTLSKATLSSVFSVVFQDYGRYALTLKENVFLTDFDDPQKAAQAERILSKLGFWEGLCHQENRMDISLGKLDEGGIDLSGGQWQKLAIARGLLSDALVYILDEPSSSLDPISERHLYDLYDKVFKEYTTITITHRLGNTKGQDEILVLDGGTLAEFGSHEALMKRHSIYYEMFTHQRSWYHAESS